MEADIDSATARIEELEMQIEADLSKSTVYWPSVVSKRQEIKFQQTVLAEYAELKAELFPEVK